MDIWQKLNYFSLIDIIREATLGDFKAIGYLRELIVFNARFKILSDGEILPLPINAEEKTKITKFAKEMFELEKRRVAGTYTTGPDEICFSEILFSLKVAYPELRDFPKEVEQSLRDWFSEARQSRDRRRFLEYAMALYALSAKEIKIADAMPVFVMPDPEPIEEPQSQVPEALNF